MIIIVQISANIPSIYDSHQNETIFQKIIGFEFKSLV